MKKFEQHPLSAAFPGMSPEVFKELIDDIDLNGVREKIVVYDGKILDGWHRYSACQELKVLKPPMLEYDGDDPVGFVLSKNLHRRHLPAGIRAMIIAKLTDWQEGAGRPSKSLDKAKQTSNFATLNQSAELAGVSLKTMQHARKATLAADEVQQAVSEGKMSISEAAKLADKPVEEQRAAVSNPKVPKEKKAMPLGAYEELLKQHEELEDDYESIAAELEMAQKELAAVDAIRKSEHMPMIMHLHQQIRSMTEARDQWQTKCNEMTKQLNFLTKNK
jgi:hypothetical protein